MFLKQGNLYTLENFNYYDYIGFTSNNIITQNGKLVMGAGNAKIVRDMFKGIDKRLGSNIKGDYLMCLDKQTRVFAFQTKRHFKDKSPIDLIEASTNRLDRISRKTGKLFAIPFPGIGHGGLDKNSVLSVIEKLPDNVHVWSYENGP